MNLPKLTYTPEQKAILSERARIIGHAGGIARGERKRRSPEHYINASAKGVRTSKAKRLVAAANHLPAGFPNAPEANLGTLVALRGEFAKVQSFDTEDTMRLRPAGWLDTIAWIDAEIDRLNGVNLSP